MSKSPLEKKLESLKEFEDILQKSKDKIVKLEGFIEKKQSEGKKVSTSDAGKILFQLKKLIQGIAVIKDKTESFYQSSTTKFEKALHNEDFFSDEELTFFKEMKTLLKGEGFDFLDEGQKKKKMHLPKQGKKLSLD